MEARFKPKREYTRGKQKVEEEGCDCRVQQVSDEDFEFYENPKQHELSCLYRILCKE